LENVRGHLSLGFKEVLKDLAINGYDARWRVVRASDVGAPHQRARLFIVAYPSNNRQPQGVFSRFEKGHSRLESDAIITDSDSHACSQSQRITRGLSEQSAGLPDRQDKGQTRKKYRSSLEMVRETIPDILANDRLNPQFVEYMMGLPKGWVTDLDITDTNKLKMLGNGVVPQQAYYAIQQLIELDTPIEQDFR
jgi:DNA (cytosine-5)-methyltransferase 1